MIGVENYVVAQVIQVAGYVTLLYAYFSIKNGEKKNKAGHNKRHACVHA